MYTRQLREFFRYYRWHIIFLALIAVCVVFVFFGVTKKENPDLRVLYSAQNYMNVQSFNDAKAEIELIIRDATGDKKRVASINAIIGNDDKEAEKNLSDAIDMDNYDIYISTKEAFEKIEDKSVFAPVESYYSISADEHTAALSDKKVGAYAASLKENSIAAMLGITNAENLYIAAAALKDDSMYRKNGMNTVGYILENKYKYKY